MTSARQLSARIVATTVLVAIGILVILLPYLVKRQKIPAPALTTATTFTDSAAVPAGTPPPDSAAVMAAMNRVVDPEVEIGIADLGLVNALAVDSGGNVSATIILTVPECPYAGQLGAQAVKEVLKVPGVRRATVRLDPTLPWDPSRLSPEARELYRKRFGKGLPPLSAKDNGGCTQSSLAASDLCSSGKPVQSRTDQGAVPVFPDSHRFRVHPCESVVTTT